MYLWSITINFYLLQMRELIKRILQLNTKKLLINIVISLLFTFMFVSMFPSILEMAEEMEGIIEAYPPVMLEAFGIDSNLFTEFSSFLGAEYFSLMWPILSVLFTISLAISAIAKEIENGSMYILLSQPLSRTKIFLGKYLSGIILTGALVYTSILLIKVLAYIYNIDFPLSSVWNIAHLSMLFACTTFSITFLASSIFSTVGKANSIAIGIVFGGYALNLIAQLQESLESLKYVSLFYYYDYVKALKGNGIGVESLLFFIGMILISFCVSLFVFKKRDISV